VKPALQPAGSESQSSCPVYIFEKAMRPGGKAKRINLAHPPAAAAAGHARSQPPVDWRGSSVPTFASMHGVEDEWTVNYSPLAARPPADRAGTDGCLAQVGLTLLLPLGSIWPHSMFNVSKYMIDILFHDFSWVNEDNWVNIKWIWWDVFNDLYTTSAHRCSLVSIWPPGGNINMLQNYFISFVYFRWYWGHYNMHFL